jgi:hypothetical protein
MPGPSVGTGRHNWQIADLAAKGWLPMTDKLAISRT